MKERWSGLLGSGGVLWKRVTARDARKELDFFLSIFPGCCHSQWEAASPCPCTSSGLPQALLKSKIISSDISLSTPKRLRFLKSSVKDHGSPEWRDVKPSLLPMGLYGLSYPYKTWEGMDSVAAGCWDPISPLCGSGPPIIS